MSGNIIKVTIEGTSPPVWRRIILPEKITFGDLHRILQIAFGWEEGYPHGFTFSQDRVRITDRWSRRVGDLLEDEYEVDDLLRANKWVRYTYGLQDGWKHKIIFEEVRPDHGLRHAVIIRARGDDPGRAFSMEKANRRLARLAAEMSSEEMRPVYVKNRIFRPSKMDEMLRRWGDPDYKGSRIEEKVSSCRSCTEILQDLSMHELEDHCKCLQIPKKVGWNKRKHAEAIYDAFFCHPGYLLYVLEEDEFESLLEFIDLPEGRVDLEAERFMADKYMVMGLLDIHMEEDAQGQRVSYALAQGAGVVIGRLRDSDWRGTAQKIRRYAGQVLDLLYLYGIMEIGACYDICRDVCDLDLEEEGFLRLLYWYGRTNGYIRILERDDDRTYVLLSEIDVERTMAHFFRIEGRIGYRRVTRREMKDLQKNGASAEDYWIPYVRYLKNIVGMERHRSYLWMGEERLDVMCGATSTDMMEDICGSFPPGTIGGWVELWLASLDICRRAGLFVLKGHSRTEYEQITGERPAFLPVIDRKRLQDRICRHTHIYQMPEEVQEQLYEAYHTPSVQKAEMMVEGILRGLPEENLEVVYMLAVCQMAGGRYRRAESTVRRIWEIDPGTADDRSLSIFLEASAAKNIKKSCGKKE